MGRGEVLARLGPDRHAKVAKEAADRGMSVNQYICEALDAALEGGGMSSSAARQAALEELGDVASRLRAGFVLVPGAEVPKSQWDQMLGGEKN